MTNDVNAGVRRLNEEPQIQSFLASAATYRKTLIQGHNLPSKAALYAEALLLLEYFRTLVPADDVGRRRQPVMTLLVQAVIDE